MTVHTTITLILGAVVLFLYIEDTLKENDRLRNLKFDDINKRTEDTND